MNNQIRVLFCRVGKPAKIRAVDNELHALQTMVDGYIETVTMPDGAILVCNEEGLLMGLPWNRKVCGVDVVGDFFITKADDEGNFIDLPEDLTRKYLELLA